MVLAPVRLRISADRVDMSDCSNVSMNCASIREMAWMTFWMKTIPATARKMTAKSGRQLTAPGSTVQMIRCCATIQIPSIAARSEEHTSELQSLLRNSYAVVCLKKKTYDDSGKPTH